MRTDAKSFDGWFWLPNRSEQKCPGNLTIQQNGSAYLELIGCFDSDPSQWNTVLTVPRIVGMAEGELPVTLDRCVYSQKAFPFMDVPKSKLHVGIAYVGLGYDSNEQFAFESFEFSVEGMDEWHQKTGFTVGAARPPFEISYRLPDPMKLWETDELVLWLVFSCCGPSMPAITSASISQSSKFRLTGTRLLTFDQFSAITHKIVHFLCLATGETVSVFDVIARSPTQFPPDGSESRLSAAVYYESRSFAEAPPEIDRFRMLFHLDQLPGGTQNSFGRWVNVHLKATAAMNLFFSVRAGEHSFLSGRFLSLAQALETYHRRSYDTVRMPKENYDKMIQALQETCPPEYRTFLAGRLMHGNEPSQRERFAELLVPFAKHFGDDAEQQCLLKRIVDTRNYYTHYADGGKTKAARGRNLWVLCGRMEVLFQLCMLREIGFPLPEIDRIIEWNGALKSGLNRPWTETDVAAE